MDDDLPTLIATTQDPDAAAAEVRKALDADRIGYLEAKQLLVAVRKRRQALAEERRRLADEFDRTVPAAEGVEAPYVPERDEDGNWRDGW